MIGLMEPMTEDEEKLLADGRNYENYSSITPGPLENLFRCIGLIERSISACKAEGIPDAYLLYCITFYFLWFISTSITQAVLRAKVIQLSPSITKELQQKSNFSRYYRMYQTMEENILLKKLMVEENASKGNDSRWVMDKVFSLLYCALNTA